MESRSDGPWLEVAGDDESGYTVTGNAAALERLGEECLRLARAAGDETADVGAECFPLRQIERREQPEPPKPMTWKDRMAGVGCVAAVLIALAIFARGCVALEDDMGRSKSPARPPHAQPVRRP